MGCNTSKESVQQAVEEAKDEAKETAKDIARDLIGPDETREEMKNGGGYPILPIYRSLRLFCQVW